jgi:hypothetical protein
MISILSLLFLQAAHAQVKVPVTFIEALAPRDSTSSEKFKADFEGAIKLGKGLVEVDLKKCGYELVTQTSFYDASDALQAKELASKAKESGSWLLIGPRRSNHYLAMVRGAEDLPSISLMAGSTEVEALGSLHTSLSPFNHAMAEVAADEAAKRSSKSSKGYISIVNGDCLNCVDFAEAFDSRAKKMGLKKLAQFTVSGEEPDVAPFKDQINKLKPAFILLPNYSKPSVKVMNDLDDKFSGYYVGADGWGDSKFGFVQKGAKSDQVQGFTVRGFPTITEGLKSFALGRLIIAKDKALPEGGPAMAALRIIDWSKTLLCDFKPKDLKSFTQAFNRRSASIHAPWGVSIYNLKNGEISFLKTIQKKGN